MRVRSAVASVALTFVACTEERKHARPDSAAPAGSAATPATAPPPTPTRDPHAPKPIPCRVISGEGEGGPGPAADASRWLDVPDKAWFSIRIAATGKEVRFEGPGRVRACGGEMALVARGTAVGLPHAGEAPGNEQWVATPCAVARWGTGVHRLAADKDGCKLQSSVGHAWLWVPEGAKIEEAPLDGGAADSGVPAPTEGWRRVDARRALRVRPPSEPPSAAVARCEKAAAEVEAIATTMADGGTAAIAELAPKSIVARRNARAACGLASARLEGAKVGLLHGRDHGSKVADLRALEARVAKVTSRLTGDELRIMEGDAGGP